MTIASNGSSWPFSSDSSSYHIYRSTDNRSRRRSREEIHAAILDIILTTTAASLNHIVVAANLNRANARMYVDELLKGGFVTASKKERFVRYEITKKGLELLQLYRRVGEKYRFS